MKPMSNELRKKIQMFIKNRLDISDLIYDVDIRNENLNRAIIKKFDRINQDISNCSFVRAVIGEEGKETHLSGTKIHNCSFKETVFLGVTYLRRIDARGSSFERCMIPYAEYQHADLRGCNICGLVIPLGSACGHGTKLSKRQLELSGMIFE